MSEAATARSVPSFRREPLLFFDQRLVEAQETFWVEPDLLCVAEPNAAKAVLANPDGLFQEHSDFFHTRQGAFGPRALQVEIAREARRLLVAHAIGRAEHLDADIERVLGNTSLWPDAANWLVYRHFQDVLAAPRHAARLGPLLEEILDKAVRAGARESRSRLRRSFFRRRVLFELTREIERRRREEATTHAPEDLFDVLALASPQDDRGAELAELYLPFFFAIVGSVGFTLAWAVRLVADAPPTEAKVGEIVREALRLWPIAWQMGRFPAVEHEILGQRVTPRTTVLVAPYVTHRHPSYWAEPTRFLPERWRGDAPTDAWFPFGWGLHTCAAAALSLDVASRALAALQTAGPFTVSGESGSPFTGPS
ncbi:MAG: cytochrome P450, partial [Acidobacteriota bacterium]